MKGGGRHLADDNLQQAPSSRVPLWHHDHWSASGVGERSGTSLSPEGNGEGVQVDCGTREKIGDVFLVWLGGASWGLAGVGTCFAPLDLDHQPNKTGFQVIDLYGSVQLVGGGDRKSATVSLTES